MNVRKSIKNKICSYFKEVIIETYDSEVSDYLEVSWVNGRKVLNCYHANYSFGNLTDVFDRIFKAIKFKRKSIENVLILGYGVGSVALLLRDKYEFNGEITGVELDKKMIEIGVKHFPDGMNAVDNIKMKDAYNYVSRIKENSFDLVIFDIFIDLYTEEKFKSEEFIRSLHRITKPKGIVLYNKIYSKDLKLEDSKVLSYFKKYFEEVHIVKIKTYQNDFIIVKK